MLHRWWAARGGRGGGRLKVLMVCMGNICRSPMAEGMLRAKLQAQGLGGQVLVDSAGTTGQHRGQPPDPRGVAQAARRGYALRGIKARPLATDDFARFDLLLAMDRHNLDDMRQRCPPEFQARLTLVLSFAPGKGPAEVPDPYYGPVAGFDHVLDLLEPACDALVLALQQRLLRPAASQS